MSDTIRMEQAGAITKLVLNRPAAYNALDAELVETLATSLTALAGDARVRGVVITGAGKAFCSGGDLRWVTAHPQGASGAFHALAARFHLAVLEIRRMPKPVVAAVNGVAAGGGFSLALACDFRVMAESAVLRQAYTASGLSIDGGGTFTLPRLVGGARALEIAAFDPPIPARQALDWGLATKVVADGAAVAEAAALAERIAAGSLHSYGWSKRLLGAAFDTPLEAHLEREREALAVCGGHAEGQEGLRAFVEKRKPTFAR
jgi:2-(1,2-epoxy-1,2-dihydrophenyl)acetyl-CoA isomerase